MCDHAYIGGSDVIFIFRVGQAPSHQHLYLQDGAALDYDQRCKYGQLLLLFVACQRTGKKIKIKSLAASPPPPPPPPARAAKKKKKNHATHPHV